MIIKTILGLAITLGFAAGPDSNPFFQKAAAAPAQMHTQNSVACKKYMAYEKKPGPPGGVDTITVGTIGDDGKIFTSDCDQKSWTIANSDAVKAYTGRTVSVHGKFDWEKATVQVKSVKSPGVSATTSTKMKD